MDYLQYKTPWTLCIREKLCDVMESTNLIDKYDVAVQRNDVTVVGHFPLESQEKLQRQYFTFFKQTKSILVEFMCLGRP